jgi:hypothetical protein
MAKINGIVITNCPNPFPELRYAPELDKTTITVDDKKIREKKLEQYFDRKRIKNKIS